MRLFNRNITIRLFNPVCSLLLWPFCSTSLLGCASTPKHEGTGEYVDDTVITSKVKVAVFNEPSLKSAEINVETFKGVVQFLSGFVSPRAQHSAEGGRSGAQRQGCGIRQERHAAEGTAVNRLVASWSPDICSGDRGAAYERMVAMAEQFQVLVIGGGGAGGMRWPARPRGWVSGWRREESALNRR